MNILLPYGANVSIKCSYIVKVYNQFMLMLVSIRNPPFGSISKSFVLIFVVVIVVL